MDNTIYWIVGIVLVVVVAGVSYALRDKARGRPVPDELKPGQSLPGFQAVDCGRIVDPVIVSRLPSTWRM